MTTELTVFSYKIGNQIISIHLSSKMHGLSLDWSSYCEKRYSQFWLGRNSGDPRKMGLLTEIML